MTLTEAIDRLVAIGAKPTGSRYVGGSTDASDIDYFIVEDSVSNRELLDIGFNADELGHYIDEIGFESLRHKTLPLNLIVMANDYYHLYDHANDRVKAMEGHPDLQTREGRVKWFKHFLAEARTPALTSEEPK